MNGIDRKPKYSLCEERQCGQIDYCGRTYWMDIADRDTIINFGKRFVFINNENMYPSYHYNKQIINYLRFIYHFRNDNVEYVFENGDPYDLRRSNVKIYHIYHKKVSSIYKVKKYIPGHYSSQGVDTYYMKNPMWIVEDITVTDEETKDIIVMYCEKDTLVNLCQKSLDKIEEYEKKHNEGRRLTFHKNTNGYILCTNISLFIHQIITGCYGNGKDTRHISIVHIDRNPLNNCFDNLRIATREEQEENTKGIIKGTKRARNKNARPLPEGLTQDMLKKYVVYYEDYADKAKKCLRQYFKVESHPKLEKIWIGRKTKELSICEKLQQANKVVDDLENDIMPY